MDPTKKAGESTGDWNRVAKASGYILGMFSGEETKRQAPVDIDAQLAQAEKELRLDNLKRRREVEEEEHKLKMARLKVKQKKVAEHEAGGAVSSPVEVGSAGAARGTTAAGATAEDRPVAGIGGRADVGGGAAAGSSAAAGTTPNKIKRGQVPGQSVKYEPREPPAVSAYL